MHKTGATRYQKFLKAERAKTKLKGKKDLPKRTNVTKTNFKVKKIIIKEQLTKHGQTEVLSSRKLNAKELLTRLGHFNTNARMVALSGIKELVTIHKESLEENLGHFIRGITPLAINVEKSVRRESIKVIHSLLSNVGLEKIDPFFDIMSTYLRSAMTHIDSRIQEDSLLILDVLLQCTPKLIADDFHKIMPIFLDMISKIKMDSKQGRTLTVNLNSDITSVKWRVKVFHRLQQFLLKFAELNEFFKAEQKTNKITHNFDVDNRNNFSLFNPIYTSVCTVNCFSSKASQTILISDEVGKFNSYIDTLMPLLFEIWLEACPNTKLDKNIETVINEDAAVLLKHTLKVISLLWKLVEHFNKKYPSSMIQDNFTQKYRSSFSQHFVSSFPYITNIRSKSTKSDTSVEDPITDSNLVTENLEICHLYISINPNVNVKKHHLEIMSVLKYVEKNFSNQFQDSISEMVLKILHTIFSKEVTSWTKTYHVLESLFRKIINSYFNDNLSDDFKQQIFGVLCKIAINDNLVSFHAANDRFETWLKKLPDILLNESINTETIDILFKFAVTNNKLFNSVVKLKFKEIIKNLPIIKITNMSNRSYYKLFSILYWVNSWDMESLKLVEHQIVYNEYKREYAKYIVNLLKYKSGYF